ncbi:MAG: hypothetical protein L0Z62_19480 [Gemmataceae bacterium]|nr:hypothetical protein [Gemmataceae bacterium]
MGLSPERLRVLRALALLERIGTVQGRGEREAVASRAPTRLTREARASQEGLDRAKAVASGQRR